LLGCTRGRPRASQDGVFRFAALQSEVGRALLQHHGRAADDISSIVLVDAVRADRARALSREHEMRDAGGRAARVVSCRSNSRARDDEDEMSPLSSSTSAREEMERGSTFDGRLV
jgi:hypothetical protein